MFMLVLLESGLIYVRPEVVEDSSLWPASNDAH